MLWPAPVPSRAPPRSFPTTLAPSLASVNAYSRPSPPPAPVTTTTRSCTPGTGVPLLDWSARLSDQLARQLLRLLCIRGIHEDHRVGSGRLGHHRLLVAELLEAELAVIGANARRPDAAEWQLVAREMEQQMV